MSKNVLILGVNGFIGSALTERILSQTNWHVYGMDMTQNKLGSLCDHERFHFFEGDITINREWVEYHVRKCDVVLPLVAIATPSVYVSDPLSVFELDFEANLPIIRQCVKYKKRVVFPSTSEVYGMCQDRVFDEENSLLTLGPIHKQRWIYSCSKQLLDRVIYAYGVQKGLDYTLFRPFNWIGPKLDNLSSSKEGSSRVLTQFIGDILYKKEIRLVDGGSQRRCFTDIDDGISALITILDNPGNIATGKIYNIGNPLNDLSMRELALELIRLVKIYKPDLTVRLHDVSAKEHYGDFYQDIQHRVPSIENAKRDLHWEPKVSLEASLKKALEYHLKEPENTLTV